MQRPAAKPVKGWDERFVGQEPRISEIAELYKSIGFDVRIEPYQPEDCGTCSECFKEGITPFYAVYTRPDPHRTGTDNDPF